VSLVRGDPAARLAALEAAHARLLGERDELEALLGLRTAELEDALERSASMEEARSRFLAVISHEIRTPVSALIGLLDLIDQTPPGEERDGYLRSARSASGHLLELVNDVLDLAKIDAGRLVLMPQRFDPLALVRGVAGMIAPLLRDRPVDLRVRPQPGLPEALVADEHRLRQILINLAGNAAKFTERGHIEIRLAHLGAAEGGARLRVEVEDTGPGISPHQQHLLFNEFIQVDLVRHRQIRGSGLGLAICKRLAEAMGGAIGLDSEPGRGSLFWFEVLAEPADTPDPGGGAAVPRGAGPRTILLAEDTPTLQIVVAGFLRQAGHSVTVAGTGEQALAALARGGFDLGIMDMMMPGMDGDEVIRRVRGGEAGPADLPMIVLTAANDLESISRARESGADRILQKPVQRDELFAAVSALGGP
jgi:signal transduction histidine kinase